MVEMDNGQAVFEYDDTFRSSGLELSPIHLPLTTRGPVRFAELVRLDAFRGLPGLLADALPDAFGSTVIRAYYTARGEFQKAFSPAQRLLYVGSRAIAALEFQPAESIPARAAEAEALEVAELVADARRIISGETSVAMDDLHRPPPAAGRRVLRRTRLSPHPRSRLSPARPQGTPRQPCPPGSPEPILPRRRNGV